MVNKSSWVLDRRVPVLGLVVLGVQTVVVIVYLTQLVGMVRNNRDGVIALAKRMDEAKIEAASELSLRDARIDKISENSRSDRELLIRMDERFKGIAESLDKVVKSQAH